MAEEKDEAKAEPQKKSPLLLIVIGAVALVLIVVIVLLLLLLGGSGDQALPARTQSGVQPGIEVSLGPVVELDQFVVNLLSNDGRRFLKTKMSFELTHKNAVQEFENKKPLIRDQILQQLSSKRFDEISTESGKVRLREDLRNNINRYLIDGQVKQIFFTDFVIQ
ncbi:MAG: flagellar basal body-associated FliL family protein [Helicobacteraceae bacterium]|nr:flagellar basal body-associated FliL family protein [Helicobacteraceae bacterium]